MIDRMCTKRNDTHQKGFLYTWELSHQRGSRRNERRNAQGWKNVPSLGARLPQFVHLLHCLRAFPFVSKRSAFLSCAWLIGRHQTRQKVVDAAIYNKHPFCVRSHVVKQILPPIKSGIEVGWFDFEKWSKHRSFGETCFEFTIIIFSQSEVQNLKDKWHAKEAFRFCD